VCHHVFPESLKSYVVRSIVIPLSYFHFSNPYLSSIHSYLSQFVYILLPVCLIEQRLTKRKPQDDTQLPAFNPPLTETHRTKNAALGSHGRWRRGSFMLHVLPQIAVVTHLICVHSLVRLPILPQLANSLAHTDHPTRTGFGGMPRPKRANWAGERVRRSCFTPEFIY
jgi:hypothetical protein